MNYIIILIFLVCSIHFYLRIARHFKIIDNPIERSSHSIETFTGGGVIFPIAVIFWLINVNFSHFYFFFVI